MRLHLAGHVQALANQQERFSSTATMLAPVWRCRIRPVMKNFRSISGMRSPSLCSAGSSGGTERQLFDDLAELHADRIGGLCGDGLQPAMDVVAGSHGTVEQVDRVRQLIFELAAAARPACA